VENDPRTRLRRALDGGLLIAPRSGVGRWALAWTAGFVLLNLVHGGLDALLALGDPLRSGLLPTVAAVMLGCGLAAGTGAGLAWWRRGDRSLLLALPLLAGLFSALYLLAALVG